MVKCRVVSLGVLALLSTGLSVAEAEILPTLSLRESTFRSDAVVLAESVDWQEKATSTQPGGPVQSTVKFKVSASLKGTLKAGQEVSLSLGDEYHLRPPHWGSSQPAAAKPRIKQALLYLAKSEHGYELTLSGMRLTDDGERVLLPMQMINPGPYYLLPAKGQNWDKLVGRAREEVATVAAVLSKRDITDPAKRNQEILAWVREHEKELSGGWFELPGREPKGWGSLAQAVFQWVYDSRRAEDAWEAAKLQRDADVGYSGYPPDCFATRELRSFLIGVASDAAQAARHRALALSLLASNCWPTYDAQKQGTLRPLEAEEQTKLLDSLLPLLKDPDEAVREEVVTAITTASLPYDAEGIKKLGTRRALETLVAMQKTDPSGSVRHRIQYALERFETFDKWQASTQPSR